MIKTIAEIENNPFCRYCKTSLDNIQFRFCSGVCQALYCEIIERAISMRHPFSISALNPFECTICKRDIKAHGNKAECESCNVIGTCELIEGMLLCIICEEKHLAARKALVEDINIPVLKDNVSTLTAADISNPTQAEIDKLTHDSTELLNRARAIDVSMRYSGDFFNAETIALSDVRNAIEHNALIPVEHKSKEFQLAIMQRIIHFQEVIFKVDNEKFEALQRIAAGKTTLREFGNDILKEIREKIAANDSTYIVAKPVKPKITSKKTKKDPYEMLVDSLMSMHNCSRNEALKMMVDHNLLNRKKEDA